VDCFCYKDEDGQCQRCAVALAVHLGRITDVQKECMVRMNELASNPPSICDGCVKQYADASMARVLEQVITEDLPKHLAAGLFQMVVQLLQSTGIARMPLTEKAWSRITLGRGWNTVGLSEEPPAG
jgi:hypothetical protein